MIFRDPWLLTLIPVITGLIFLANRKGRDGSIQFSNGELLSGLQKSTKIRVFKNLHLLRVLSSILIILALARPQSILEETRIRTEGLDMILAIDVSTSMLAEDFQIRERRMNRLSAVKEVAREFIRQRNHDRIGIVIFAAKAYTVCPLTLDHEWLLEHLGRIEIGMIEDNTALGSGLGSALNRLKGTPSKRGIVILLTDGRNNAGETPPLTAAAAARALETKVYTIGAGSRGPAPYPARDIFGKTIYRSVPLDMDEDLLKEIALRTRARYFRVADAASLEETFQEIDRLEKTIIEQKTYLEYHERFPFFLIPGLALLCLEIILRSTVLRKVP
jgi:Ca-activated chloride channel homolog